MHIGIFDLLDLSRTVLPVGEKIMEDVKEQKWSDGLRDSGELCKVLADWLDNHPVKLGAVHPEGFLDLHLGQRLFARLVRKHCCDAMEADGFKLIGGSETPLSRAKIKEVLADADVSDELILSHATRLGAIGDGSILARLQELLNWIIDHKEQIMELVKFLLSIFALFA